MQLFGFTLFERKQTLTIDQLINRLEAAYATSSNIVVTPDSAMESPTVQAIVQSVAGTLSTLPIHVKEQTVSGGRTSEEVLPKHPVANLLRAPSETQDRVTYWLDAASWLVRYGNHYAVKARGLTGPIRFLQVIPPAHLQIHHLTDGSVVYRTHLATGEQREYRRRDIHHARGAARDGIKGDSPVMDVRESIALEIAAERFGASFFGNGAMPSLVFSHLPTAPLKDMTEEQRKKFLESFQQAYGNKTQRFKALLLPRGLDLKPIEVQNDKAQFLETRKLQRTIIAGAFGIPPHLVGDLERATFSNVEHQSLEFVQRVILRYARIFEAAMEADLLTPADRANGVIIRFNLDGALRADFRTRQEGLKLQREMGVLTGNEWREVEGRNPLPGLDEVWTQGPSGQNTATPPATTDEDEEEEDPANAARNGRPVNA